MTILYTGNAVPLDGKRRLTSREAQQRARALACIRSPTSTQCQGQLFVGIFFDGTGNNQWHVDSGRSSNQRELNKHSNVARLWEAHIDDPENGIFRMYVPGIGTPFKEIGDTNQFMTDFGGGGFGLMGADRICWAITSLLNYIHRYLTRGVVLNYDEQKRVCQLMSSKILTGASESVIRWSMLKKVEQTICSAVQSSQRKITQISVSIFGFSRGAAEARACAHWLNQIFSSTSGGFEVASLPIRIGFMGIFDTVSAVGIGDTTPITSGHMAWADGTQSIHPSVEQCAHFIALHEQRAGFPLESATGRGNVGYPGMHSDVGGGYLPGEQGKSMPEWGISPHLSQIPLLDMHLAALKAGVPLSTIDEIKATPSLARSFSTDRPLVEAYNNWVLTNGIKPAPVAEFTRAHTNQYLRWRGSLHRGDGAGIKTKRFFTAARGSDVKDLAEADANLGILLNSWRERQTAHATLRGRSLELAKDVVRASPFGPILFIDSGKDPLSDHERHFLAVLTQGPLPPPASVRLFEEFVHDSRAGFRVLSRHEPEWLTGGYARYRNVFAQSETEGSLYVWANESLREVEAATGAAVDFFQRLYDYSKSTYDLAREKIDNSKRILQNNAALAYKSVEYAARVAKTRAHDAAITYEAAQRQVLMKYIVAQDEWYQQWKERCERGWR